MSSREMGTHARRRHQDYQRAAAGRRAGEIVPRNSVGGVFRGILMASDNGHERAAIAMGQRNSREGRRGYRGGHARHDFERDSCRSERLGLLAAATEDERVATFEAHDAAARAGVFEEDAIDFGLIGAAFFAAFFTGENTLGGGRREAQDFGTYQRVVNDNVRPAHHVGAAHRDEVGRSRTGTDEEDAARVGVHGETGWLRGDGPRLHRGSLIHDRSIRERRDRSCVGRARYRSQWRLDQFRARRVDRQRQRNFVGEVLRSVGIEEQRAQCEGVIAARPLTPTGETQDAPMVARNARSAVASASARESLSAAMAASISSAPPRMPSVRASSASAPCPPEGTNSRSSSSSKLRPSSLPRRLRPAIARTIASKSPCASRASRVSTLPRRERLRDRGAGARPGAAAALTRSRGARRARARPIQRSCG